MGNKYTQQDSGGHGMKKKTITELSARLVFLESWLSTPIQNISTWAKVIREYHALNIKIAQMEGERLIANEFQSDRLI